MSYFKILLLTITLFVANFAYGNTCSIFTCSAIELGDNGINCQSDPLLADCCAKQCKAAATNADSPSLCDGPKTVQKDIFGNKKAPKCQPKKQAKKFAFEQDA